MNSTNLVGQTSLARKMIKKVADGTYTEEFCMFYGIAGVIPGSSDLTKDEKALVLQGRMRRMYGDNWKEMFSSLPEWLLVDSEEKYDWVSEGF